MKNEKIITDLNIINISGLDELKSKSKGIYLVGGIVRDFFLNKKSKDIDIVVCGLYYDDIINILSKYGEVIEVGKSFGVLKYKPKNWKGEAIDVAIPRKDYKIGEGHQGFEVDVDPFLPIEKELNRRDFTINSIAVSLDGQIIDPFNGLSDLKNKIIRATSPKAFTEDPLRMCRAIQFASRFQFTIEEKTWKMILDNKSDIKLISGERILEELDKIFFKGDIQLGLKLFKDSGLHFELFSTLTMLTGLNIKTREDFYFTICKKDEAFKDILKGDKLTAKGIKAIRHCWEESTTFVPAEIRQIIFESIQISDRVLECQKLPSYILSHIEDFTSGKLPKFTKELAVNGDELMELGHLGIEVGKRQKFFLKQIFSDSVSNIKTDLIKTLDFYSL